MSKTYAVVSSLLVVLLLAGCTNAQAAPQITPAPTMTPTTVPSPEPIVTPEPVMTGPVKMAVVGDSLTSWNPPYAGIPERSWVNRAIRDDVELVGGWARPGAATGKMVANVQPVPDAEVLVVMAGINDIADGVAEEARLVNIETIVSTVGASNVVLSATAPYNRDPGVAVAWNEVLRVFAVEHEWSFIDPWHHVRTVDGGYVAGATVDGVHPTGSVAVTVGNRVHDSLVALFR